MSRKIVKFFALMLTVISMFTAVGCKSSEESKVSQSIEMKFDWKSYLETDALVSDSDYIIIGEVISTNNDIYKSYPYDSNMTKDEMDALGNYVINTVSDIKVHQVLKGDLDSEEVVKVKQVGGIVDEVEYFVKNSKKLSEGSKYRLLFLKDFTDVVPSEPYALLNPVEANIELDVKVKNKKIDLESSKISVQESDLFKDGEPLKDVISNIEKLTEAKG